jgi:hypothetical protein
MLLDQTLSLIPMSPVHTLVWRHYSKQLVLLMLRYVTFEHGTASFFYYICFSAAVLEDTTLALLMELLCRGEIFYCNLSCELTF